MNIIYPGNLPPLTDRTQSPAKQDDRSIVESFVDFLSDEGFDVPIHKKLIDKFFALLKPVRSINNDKVVIDDTEIEKEIKNYLMPFFDQAEYDLMVSGAKWYRDKLASLQRQIPDKIDNEQK
jgi:hypothetical protein